MVYLVARQRHEGKTFGKLSSVTRSWLIIEAGFIVLFMTVIGVYTVRIIIWEFQKSTSPYDAIVRAFVFFAYQLFLTFGLVATCSIAQ